MALADLLWGCPECGEDRALGREHAVCGGCGTRFVRGQGATICARGPDGAETVASAAEWLARLPEPESLLDREPVRTARVSIRRAERDERVYGETGYLNRVEVFGERVPGRLRLERDRLVVETEAGPRGASERASDGASPEVWPLESLTAMQTSSRNLQLKRRGEPVVAFDFEDDAIYLWEQLLRAALRDFYRRTGRGEIREFQPRIVAA